jgi:Tol biopolymer transport system component
VAVRQPDSTSASAVAAGASLVVMDADGRNTSVIRTPAGRTAGFSVDNPSWSPDGSTIAFVQRYCGAVGGVPADRCPGDSDRAENMRAPWSEIRAVRPDGGGERVLLSQPDHYSDEPSWSPDGRRLTFMRARSADLHWNVFVAGADGSSPVNITNEVDRYAGNPAWSPDGRWIAFTSSVMGSAASCGNVSSGLVLIRPDGTGRAVISDGTAGCDHDAAWGPDGSWLAFNRTVSQEHERAGDVWIKRIEDVAAGQVRGSEVRVTSGVDPAVRPRP